MGVKAVRFTNLYGKSQSKYVFSTFSKKTSRCAQIPKKMDKYLGYPQFSKTSRKSPDGSVVNQNKKPINVGLAHHLSNLFEMKIQTQHPLNRVCFNQKRNTCKCGHHTPPEQLWVCFNQKEWTTFYPT